MKKDTYDSLTEKEKMMYDELSAFAQRMAERMEEQNELLKTLIAMVQEPQE